jgi:hypothetical protein
MTIRSFGETFVQPFSGNVALLIVFGVMGARECFSSKPSARVG